LHRESIPVHPKRTSKMIRPRGSDAKDMQSEHRVHIQLDTSDGETSVKITGASNNVKIVKGMMDLYVLVTPKAAPAQNPYRHPMD
jgi:rRNA processing protein Krr1/Pno1